MVDGRMRKDSHLPSAFLAENDELLGLLHENLRTVGLNRYNLEVYISIAQLYRQNLEMLLDLGRINSLLETAQKAAGEEAAGSRRVARPRASTRETDPPAAQHRIARCDRHLGQGAGSRAC